MRDPYRQIHEKITYVHRGGLPPAILPDIPRDHRILYHRESCPRLESDLLACKCPFVVIQRNGEIGIPRFKRSLQPTQVARPPQTADEKQARYAKGWATRRARAARQRGEACSA